MCVYFLCYQILEMNNQNVDYLLELMSPSNPCDDIIARCRWKGSLYRCDSLFQLVNTSEGVCCSFNNHAYPKWNYNPKVLSSIPKEPRRVTSCGFQTGLTLLLRPSTEDYLGTQIASGGFKVKYT
jgi:acid-sensing ion channel, other